MKKVFRNVVGFLLLLAVLLAAVGYMHRNSVLDNLLRAEFAKVESQRGLLIDYEAVSLDGLRDLQISGLCVKPMEGDTLLLMGKAEAKVSLTNLLRKRLLLKRLRLSDVDLRLVDTAGVRNFDLLLHSGAKGELRTDSLADHGGDYAERLSDLFDLFFRFAPEQIRVEEARVSLLGDSLSLRAYLPDFSIEDNHYSSQVVVDENGDSQRFLFSGSFSNGDRSIACSISSPDAKRLHVPYVASKFGADIFFDSLQLRFREQSVSAACVQLAGSLDFSHLSLSHPKLSDTLVSFPSGGMDCVLNVHPDDFELDSASVVTLGQLRFSPYVKVTPRPEVKLQLAVRKDFFPAQQLFASLPEGLFKNLEGIVTSGDLSYELTFDLDMAAVDSLKFHSFMGKRDFKIERYGKTNFASMNDSFRYSAYDKGELVRTFEVGTSNPDFRPLDQISPYLQAAVMYSEDGAFYAHRGFLETAMTSSIIRNIKEGRFARGGSTISMQLIKNLYLSRDKTLTRKLEEALIVWLVENNRLASKQRMLEVYLNIIEWGPGVYGANEAARFYFDKDVAKLSPEEAVFMACVIPRPKKFYWLFDKQGELRSFLEGHYAIVGKRMMDNGYITEAQLEALRPKVTLTGEARRFLSKQEAVDVDRMEDVEADVE